MDADYIFVNFGGPTQHTLDDVGKYGWFPRVAAAEFSHIQEADYKVNDRAFVLGRNARPATKRSLIHKLSYYRYREFNVAKQGLGFDRARKYIVVAFTHAGRSHKTR